MSFSQLKSWIKKYEGKRNYPYTDSVGKLTIGWGRNLENGISDEEAEMLFQNDFERAKSELEGRSWYILQPPSVRHALIHMNFNMGFARLLTFKKMIQALINKDYPLAAREAFDSKWAVQVGDRAKDIAVMISEGQ